jgi:hypothetical protein
MGHKRPSRNNRRKTIHNQSYTIHSINEFWQYEHIFDENHFVVIYKYIKDPKSVFDYDELLNWLEVNSFQSYDNNIRNYATKEEIICE